MHAFCASYVSTPVLQTAQPAYYPQPQPYDYFGQPYEYYGQQPVYAKYPAQPMYHGYGSHQEEQPPPPPPGIPPAPEVDEGGKVDFPLKKEEDEAEPYGGAPGPETKPEQKPEPDQEAVPHGGAPEPEAKPEHKQQPADPRELPPARREPLLTQKGPEADVATVGGTGCGCVPSHALLPFRMSGFDVTLGTSGSALRVVRVVRVGFMRVPGDLRRGLHVSRVLQNGRLMLRMKMTKNGTRVRYSGDRQHSQQGRSLRGTHRAADHTHNRYNSTRSNDFIDKEWQWEDVQNVADTRMVGGPSRTTTHRLHQQPRVARIPLGRKAGPRGRGGAEWCGGYLGSGACCGGEGWCWGSGPKRGTADGSGGRRNGRREGKLKGGKEVREPSAP